MTTRLIDDRELGLKIGYLATDWTQPVAFEDYAKRLENWSVKTIERDQEPIGAVYQKDDELHVSVLPEWRRRWLTKGLYKELFVNKKVTTQVTPGHEYMYDILRRIGFRSGNNNLLVKE